MDLAMWTELICCQRCEQVEKCLLHKGQLFTLESIEMPVGAATKGNDRGPKTSAAEETGTNWW